MIAKRSSTNFRTAIITTIRAKSIARQDVDKATLYKRTSLVSARISIGG